MKKRFKNSDFFLKKGLDFVKKVTYKRFTGREMQDKKILGSSCGANSEGFALYKNSKKEVRGYVGSIYGEYVMPIY